MNFTEFLADTITNHFTFRILELEGAS